MQTRRFGRTGHLSTVAILGGFAFSEATQTETDALMEIVNSYGINHIDIAPTYGISEEQIAPWISKYRQDYFLGCKTTERSASGAEAELHRSLTRLKTDYFDLYQIHAITTWEELDSATRKGGTLDLMIKAREQGYARYIGITGHGMDCPEIFLEALERFDFDSILFPLNFIVYADASYRRFSEQLLSICSARDIGVMAIKSIAKSSWGDMAKTHITWYEPFTDPSDMQMAINFVLSQPVTGICTAGDPGILPKILAACENFHPVDIDENETIISSASQFNNIFT